MGEKKHHHRRHPQTYDLALFWFLFAIRRTATTLMMSFSLLKKKASSLTSVGSKNRGKSKTVVDYTQDTTTTMRETKKFCHRARVICYSRKTKRSWISYGKKRHYTFSCRQWKEFFLVFGKEDTPPASEIRIRKILHDGMQQNEKMEAQLSLSLLLTFTW